MYVCRSRTHFASASPVANDPFPYFSNCMLDFSCVCWTNHISIPSNILHPHSQYAYLSLCHIYRFLWILPENVVLPNGPSATPEIQLRCDHTHRTYSQVPILRELLPTTRQFAKSRRFVPSKLKLVGPSVVEMANAPSPIVELILLKEKKNWLKRCKIKAK